MPQRFARNYQDPELSTLVARICAALKTQSEGKPLSYSVDTGTFDRETLNALAERMCDDGDFASALPIALHLTADSPRRSDYAFMAASCLQRLGRHEPALALFTASALSQEDNPAAWLRMGECLKALGKPDEAIDALERSVELARKDARHAPVQEAAQCVASTLY